MPVSADNSTARSPRRATPAAVILVVGVLAAGPLLGGCGSDGSPDRPTAPATSDLDLGVVEDGAHNRQDAAFARDMIVRHRQSVAMARLAKGRTGNDKVLALARRIEDAETPEITQLSRWLAEWRQPVPAASVTTGSAMPGTASAADLQALAAAKDADFDRRFLTLMIAAHEGAISQSQDQIKAGADERAKGLAADIAAAQEADVAEMKKLLGA